MSGQISSTVVARDRAFHRILDSVKQLPSPSEVCLAVTRATEAQHTTLAELQSLVESDIALSGRLMQVANSSFFGVREQVTSVRRAISLLGFATVRTLALGFFFNEEFGKLRLPGLPYPDLPRFALASSVLAESIANAVDRTLAAEAACLGLLHESGVIIMAMAFGNHYRQMLRLGTSSSADLAGLEKRTFGLNHPLAGQLLFENWRLGPDLAAAVAYHHQVDPQPELSASCAPLWKSLLLANALALPLLGTQQPSAQGTSACPAQAQPSAVTDGVSGEEGDSAGPAASGPTEPGDLARRLFDWPAAKLNEIVQEARLMYHQRLAILGRPADPGDTDTAETGWNS
jgi:HD-like signal output (HDOD) protein